MAQVRTLSSCLCELIAAYQELTKKSYTEMALDFGITLSNLYLYRTGRGNPRAKTIDRIVRAVAENCPEALEAVHWITLGNTPGDKKEREQVYEPV